MNLPDIKKMIILCLSPLGDTLFATPAIRALGENLPGARAIIIASQSAARILKSNPYGMEIAVCHDQWTFFKHIAALRKENYDIALSLSQLGSFFTRFCGTTLHRDFFDIDNRPNQTVIEMCLQVVSLLNLPLKSRKTEFWMHNTEAVAAESKIIQHLETLNYSGTPLIAIHCGGHYFSRKRWPVVNFIKLIRMLHSKIGMQAVLIGGREDCENSCIIQTEIPQVMNLTGLLKLEETAALLKRCRLLIGNDSGPLHLGAAVGVPTLGLFGPTAPRQFYPYLPPFHHLIYKAMPCSPCYKFGGGLWQQIPKCSRAYCMEAITPEEVAQEVELKYLDCGKSFMEPPVYSQSGP